MKIIAEGFLRPKELDCGTKLLAELKSEGQVAFTVESHDLSRWHDDIKPFIGERVRVMLDFADKEAGARGRGIVEAPRWSGIPTLLRDLAFETDVQLSMNIEKGWIMETVRYITTGPLPNVTKFRSKLEELVRERQRDFL